MNRKLNFYAGPSTLPVEVLREMKENIDDYHGHGYSIIEASHRGKAYDDLHNEAIALLKELLQIPENYHVLFLGGGATLQFSMIPYNLLPEGKKAAFIRSGHWAKKAVDDAKKIGSVDIVYDGEENGFTSLPAPSEVKLPSDAAYLHLTSNETIGGIQWKGWPDTGDVPIVADMSSDILSRPIPVEKFGLIYAGAQKNLGPAGATIVIVRDDLVGASGRDLPAYLDYQIHIGKNSIYNTPPVFSIWGIKLVLEWVKKNGGAEGMAQRAKERSGMLYKAIDESGGFYRSPVDSRYRSTMNVVFRLPTEDLEAEFIKQAEQEGMLGLKGHRSVGGCRASLYNSQTLENVQALVDFMQSFAQKKG